MKIRTKVWFIIAASLVLTGCIIFTGVMAIIKWDFSKLSTQKFENSDYKIEQEYKHISIITNTADILLVPSEDQTSSVYCHELKNNTHSVTVKDGTLVIEVSDSRKWYEHIGISFGKPKITVSVPQGEYGALSVKSDTGDVEIPKEFGFESIDISESTGNVTNAACALKDIKIKTTTGSINTENVSAAALELSVSTGRVTASGITASGDVTVRVSTGKATLNDIKCKNVISSGSTGDIFLNNVIAEQKFSVERSTGKVKFEGSDAHEIYVKTDTGSVTGDLLTDKVFIAHSDTGRVEVPKTVNGGRCEINTDTGNIVITIGEKA
ncbi:MAG: DUF4097 family beta strand repeat protein [Clostridia bacterium]|nr:DUF4097 family beta strand repeat protein [Clostridia bacterium]